VQNVHRVHLLQRGGQLLDLIPDFVFVDAFGFLLGLLDHLLQVALLAPLDSYDQLVIDYARVELAHDVGVLDRLEQLYLLEALLALHLVHLVEHLYHLQRHRFTRLHVPSPLNYCEFTLSYRFLYFII